MKYKIITDRFEIEKMAEDSFLSDDKTIIHVDYADLRALKRWGTFKHAIICDFNVAANSDWTEEFKNIIKTIPLPLNNLNAFYLNIIEGGNEDDLSLSYMDMSKLLEYLVYIRCLEECSDDIPDNRTTCLYTVKNRTALPKSTIQIQLMSAYEKTEQDKKEDEKYEQMIEEYRKPYFPPLDLPIIELYPNDKE